MERQIDLIEKLLDLECEKQERSGSGGRVLT